MAPRNRSKQFAVGHHCRRNTPTEKSGSSRQPHAGNKRTPDINHPATHPRQHNLFWLRRTLSLPSPSGVALTRCLSLPPPATIAHGVHTQSTDRQTDRQPLRSGARVNCLPCKTGLKHRTKGGLSTIKRWAIEEQQKRLQTKDLFCSRSKTGKKTHTAALPGGRYGRTPSSTVPPPPTAPSAPPPSRRAPRRPRPRKHCRRFVSLYRGNPACNEGG